jgi:anthranilate/para-aminobenzoate synthase component II
MTSLFHRWSLNKVVALPSCSVVSKATTVVTVVNAASSLWTRMLPHRLLASIMLCLALPVTTYIHSPAPCTPATAGSRPSRSTIVLTASTLGVGLGHRVLLDTGGGACCWALRCSPRSRWGKGVGGAGRECVQSEHQSVQCEERVEIMGVCLADCAP